MRAVLIMYDSLNKRFLGPYGNSWIKTPNFDRLARRCVTFDDFYVGSLPCMPARREMAQEEDHYYRYSDHMKYGTLLFDRQADPLQGHPLEDSQTVQRLCRLMVQLMQENEAPREQYVRLGLTEGFAERR